MHAHFSAVHQQRVGHVTMKNPHEPPPACHTNEEQNCRHYENPPQEAEPQHQHCAELDSHVDQAAEPHQLQNHADDSQGHRPSKQPPTSWKADHPPAKRTQHHPADRTWGRGWASPPILVWQLIIASTTNDLASRKPLVRKVQGTTKPGNPSSSTVPASR